MVPSGPLCSLTISVPASPPPHLDATTQRVGQADHGLGPQYPCAHRQRHVAAPLTPVAAQRLDGPAPGNLGLAEGRVREGELALDTRQPGGLLFELGMLVQKVGERADDDLPALREER